MISQTTQREFSRSGSGISGESLGGSSGGTGGGFGSTGPSSSGRTALDLGEGGGIVDDIADLAGATRAREAFGTGGGESIDEVGHLAGNDDLLSVVRSTSDQRRAEREAEREAKRAADAEQPIEYPYDSGTTILIGGKQYGVYMLEDGTVAALDDDGNIVQVIQHPPYEGDYPRPLGEVWDPNTKELREAYETEDGFVVFLDEDGEIDGVLVDPRMTNTFYEIDPKTGEAGWVTYEVRPNDEYGWDYYDMETGEYVGPAGKAVPWTDPYTGKEYVVTSPPGAQTPSYVIDPETGEIVDVWAPAPPEPAWSILGIVEGGNGTGFTFDFGVVGGNITINGDGFSVSGEVDLGVASGEAGLSWDKDDGFSAYAGVETPFFEGSAELNIGPDGWDLAASAGVGIPGLGHVKGSTSFGVDDGNAFFHASAEGSLRLGLLELSGEMSASFVETDDGFVLDLAAEGRVGAFGAYLEGSGHLNVTKDDDGTSTTLTGRAAVGHEHIGELGVSASVGFDVGADGTLGGRFGFGVDAESEHWGRAEAGVEWSATVEEDGSISTDTETWAEVTTKDDDAGEVDHGTFEEKFGQAGPGAPDDDAPGDDSDDGSVDGSVDGSGASPGSAPGKVRDLDPSTPKLSGRDRAGDGDGDGRGEPVSDLTGMLGATEPTVRQQRRLAEQERRAEADQAADKAADTAADQADRPDAKPTENLADDMTAIPSVPSVPRLEPVVRPVDHVATVADGSPVTQAVPPVEPEVPSIDLTVDTPLGPSVLEPDLGDLGDIDDIDDIDDLTLG